MTVTLYSFQACLGYYCMLVIATAYSNMGAVLAVLLGKMRYKVVVQLIKLPCF